MSIFINPTNNTVFALSDAISIYLLCFFMFKVRISAFSSVSYSPVFSMRIHHIKKLLLPETNPHNLVVLVDCPGDDDDDCYDSLSPPPPPPPPPAYESKSNILISRNLLLLFCILAAFLILICFLIILRKYRLNRRRTTSHNLDQTNEEFINVHHGPEAPELIHPIWLINTIGLQQSVIDSIAIFKYKKEEVLIEGTDCSVCLSEFQEDESLRLLPKCSHAFHIPCIDTWLRSHRNCPLCRAPVVADPNNVDVSSVERNLNELSSTEDNLADNFETSGELAVDQAGEERANTGVRNVGDNLDKSSPRNLDVGVQSDLADHIGKMEGELQQRRRSISMDSSSASMIHFAAAANIHSIGDEAYLKKVDSSKVARKGTGSNSGIFEAMKSSSFRHYSEKRPISMKRSLSSSGKQRSSRSQDSILPF